MATGTGNEANHQQAGSGLVKINVVTMSTSVVSNNMCLTMTIRSMLEAKTNFSTFS